MATLREKERCKNMTNKILVITGVYLLFSPFLTCFAQESEQISWKNLPLTEREKRHVASDRVIVYSNMESISLENENQRGQKWTYHITGLHPSNCTIALRRLARYEDYSQYINFITESRYDEKTMRPWFKLESTLLPFSMILNFTLPRMEKPGIYPYRFDQGFLLDLSGEIHISEHKNRCLFHSKANWRGPHTGIPNLVFESFSRIMSIFSMERLFHHSRF